MEKQKAHYPLDKIKELVEAESYRFTMSARRTFQNELGLTEDEAVEVILNLEARDLYKSMTAYSNHRLWQDVYKPVWEDGKLYIKLQMQEDLTIIISFKKEEDW